MLIFNIFLNIVFVSLFPMLSMAMNSIGRNMFLYFDMSSIINSYKKVYYPPFPEKEP